MKKIILWGLAFLISLYLGTVLFIYSNQRNMQYSLAGEVLSLSEANIAGAKLVVIPVDIMQVRGWYLAPKENKPTILYYKGNAGSFTDEYFRFKKMGEDGYGFLAFDYSGFPMSPGETTQKTVLVDSLAVFDWLSKKDNSIVIWGRSLGSGPASFVASRRDAKALILESPFTSAVDIAQKSYPYIPVASLMKDKYPVIEWIAKVDEPLLLAHGEKDKTIPVSNGQEVFAKAKNPQQLWIIEDGNHDNLWENNIWQQVKTFVN
jgi:hypothetical protein